MVDLAISIDLSLMGLLLSAPSFSVNSLFHEISLHLIYHPQFGIGTKKYEKAKELKLNGRDVKILSINEFIAFFK